jgi:hypothetical protein
LRVDGGTGVFRGDRWCGGPSGRGEWGEWSIERGNIERRIIDRSIVERRDVERRDVERRDVERRR